MLIANALGVKRNKVRVVVKRLGKLSFSVKYFLNNYAIYNKRYLVSTYSAFLVYKSTSVLFLGGGFGGKEVNKAAVVALPVAVAAYKYDSCI